MTTTSSYARNFATNELERATRRLRIKRDKPILVDKVIIQRPYTMVELAFGEDHYYGFAKASPQDEFDPEVGISIATFRAVREVSEFNDW